jgi:hypothetical protein
MMGDPADCQSLVPFTCFPLEEAVSPDRQEDGRGPMYALLLTVVRVLRSSLERRLRRGKASERHAIR